MFEATGITAAREAEYYDLFTEWREDIDFFVTVAKQYGGPVLEVGCGTGRVTRQIAAAGIDIDGFDISPERLRIAREALPAEHGVRLFSQDMRDFRLPGSYRLVMFPYRVLQELATTAEKIQCLSLRTRPPRRRRAGAHRQLQPVHPDARARPGDIRARHGEERSGRAHHPAH